MNRMPIKTPPPSQVDRSRCDSEMSRSRSPACNKWYGEFHVLKDINLTVRGRAHRHLRPVRLGQVDHDPLHQPAGGAPAGRIVVDGIELTNDLKKIDEIRREVGMVFQHFNLFPHLTVLENCTLAPIWVRKMPKKQAEEIAMHYLEAREDPRAGAQVSGPALRRPAAARRHRPQRCA
jgi:general L-amino acid transport system ATP-binding protein